MALLLSSGTAVGQGLLWQPPVEGAGAASGAATVTGDGLAILGGKGAVTGTGTLYGYFPEPLVGTSTMVGEAVVEHAPPPVCTCRTPQPVARTRCSCGGTIVVVQDTPCSCDGSRGTLRWGQAFQPGDLRLYLRDSFGPVNPNSVSYTLFWVRNGIPYQAGPANRVPARGPNVGEFYVTGQVGDFGQPGQWMVRWYYQRNFFSPVEYVDYPFTVQDAVAAADPRDTTVRVLKYGWN